MSKNKVQEEGYLIQVTAPYTAASGGGVLVGSLFGVAESDITSGALGIIDTAGVFNLTKATGAGTAFAFGGRVFWDDANRVVTPVAPGNTEIGIATAAATTSDTSVRVRLGLLEPQQLTTFQFSALATASVVSQVFAVAPAPLEILGVREVHSTLGTDAGAVTASVEKLTGTQAAGAGVSVLSATANLKAANNTVQTPALSATPANLQLAAGDRLGFVLAGVNTSVAGLVITVLARYL